MEPRRSRQQQTVRHKEPDLVWLPRQLCPDSPRTTPRTQTFSRRHQNRPGPGPARRERQGSSREPDRVRSVQPVPGVAREVSRVHLRSNSGARGSRDSGRASSAARLENGHDLETSSRGSHHGSSARSSRESANFVRQGSLRTSASRRLEQSSEDNRNARARVPESEQDVLSIDQIKPSSRRVENEYVDPFKKIKNNNSLQRTSTGSLRSVNTIVRVDSRSDRDHVEVRTVGHKKPKFQHNTSTIKKETDKIKIKVKTEVKPEEHPFFHCSECGRCKCPDCAQKKVESTNDATTCGNRLMCTGEDALEYATCMCCVKGVFYHCSKDNCDDDFSSADNPCSCSRKHCFLRWTALGLMGMFLPCLLCYLPVRGCMRLTTACNHRGHKKGCLCRSQAQSINYHSNC
ncbi:PREDICTED: protein sprouty homolog 4-like [Branchiostoma belcheri]|uniref:Protein sprouty homolog 4-like n=1 Tax=Branchiostoma belcheri TaxID=7741 RepID=A0A6P4YIY7_BRABE|nr:PREDICTED: protein sprouty homolog 4-like [Branchiostoma belcheri]XP_019624388.1 PREDICTED: protein sprouty homolog 4-like [Branchiostoma belcheri]